MSKLVETPNPYVSPRAANIEDMTQPMGPLEEGDQALVDATHLLPEGRHEIRGGDGNVTWVNKSESLGQNIAVVNTITADGGREHAGTLINTVPGMQDVDVDGYRKTEDITADLGHSTAWDQGSGSKVHVAGNRVGADFDRLKVGTRRAEAQAIKLEVAGQLDAARQQLGHEAVESAQR